MRYLPMIVAGLLSAGLLAGSGPAHAAVPSQWHRKLPDGFERFARCRLCLLRHEDTLERIHEQVPGAPVLRKPLFRRKLIDAVAAADPARDIAVNALCFGFSPPRTSGSWQ